MGTLLLNKIKDNKTKTININFSKISNTLIENTKRILKIDNINILEDNYK